MKGPGLEVIEIDHKEGKTDLEQLERELDENVASVVVQYPNFFGQIEPLAEIRSIVDQEKKRCLLLPAILLRWVI